MAAPPLEPDLPSDAEDDKEVAERKGKSRRSKDADDSSNKRGHDCMHRF